MRSAIVAIVALSVGAIGGAFALHLHLAARLDAGENERSELLARNQELNKRLSDLTEYTRGLESEAGQLKHELESTRQEHEALAALSTAPDLLESPLDEVLATPEDESEAERAPDDEPGRDRRRWGTPEERAAREERFREFAARARTRASEVLVEQIALTTDPDAQRRLATMAQYVDDMFELGSQMRNSEDEEEREALREAMGQTRDALETLGREQRDYMVRELASQYGITSPEKQAEFINSLSTLRSNPLFRYPYGMGGPGGPGRGGGWGYRPPGPPRGDR